MTAAPKAEPRIDYLRPAGLPGVEFLLADNDQGIWHLFHERYVLCAVDRASTLVRYRNKTEHVHNGLTMLMEPGETHVSWPVYVDEPAFTFRVVFFDPALVVGAAKEQGLRRTPHFHALLASHAALNRAIYRLSAAVEGQETILEQQSRLMKCLRLAFTHAEEAPPAASSSLDDRTAVRRARAYLQERSNEPVSLDELSSVARLSPYHLVRSFTREMGLPPHAYQIHLRVERARALLQAGLSLAEIAPAVGFADQSHFTRHFRRIMRVTPASYARAVR